MVTETGNAHLAEGKIGEYSGRIPRKSRKNVLSRDGRKEPQCCNSNFGVSKNVTRTVKQLNDDDFPRGKPQKTHPQRSDNKPMGCAGAVKLSSGADDCRQLTKVPHSDSKSISSQKPQCASQEEHLAMGQTCTPHTRSYADILKKNTTGAESKPAHQPIPSDSRDAVLGRTGQVMTRGTQLQQSDRSQHQREAKTNMQLFLENHHFTLFSKLMAENGIAQLAEGKIGECSGRLPNMSKKTGLPRDGRKELQCSNPNFSVSKNMTSAGKRLKDDDFPRGKPKNTSTKPKRGITKGCADPVKPNPAADECRKLQKLSQSDSKGTNSKRRACRVKRSLGADECQQLREPSQSDSKSTNSKRCAGRVKRNLGADECQQLREPSQSDSKSTNSKRRARRVKRNLGSDECQQLREPSQSYSKSTSSKRCAGRVKRNLGADECQQLREPSQSESKSTSSKRCAGRLILNPAADDSRQEIQLPQSDSESISSQGCVGSVESNPRASECQRQSQIPNPDSTSSDSKKQPYADNEAHSTMGQTCTSVTRSYAEVLTGARSQPPLVDRPTSSDFHDAVLGHIDQEMVHGTQTQMQESDESHHQQPAETKGQLFLENHPFLPWPPSVNNQIDHNNTDIESCHDGQYGGQHGGQQGGHSPVVSDDEGYDDTLDHMASDTDNDPWGPRIRSLGRLNPETFFDWPFGYCITHLLFMESLGSNYLETVTGCETTNVDTRPVQHHHLSELWTWFLNEWHPWLPVTYEQYVYLTSISEWLQQQESAAYMYTPDDQMEAIVPAGIYPEADMESAFRVQSASISNDSCRYSELCCMSDTA